MNTHLLTYLTKDSWQGLRRNPGSTLASIFLMAIALLLIGLLLSVRLFTADAIDYIESQLTMKVYIGENVEATSVAAVLADNPFIEHATVEAGEETLDQLTFLFHGKEHLLEAFREDALLDAVKLQVIDNSMMERVAVDLEAIEGVEQVVYPQEMAATLERWVTKFERYGAIAVSSLFVVAFLMVYVSFRLALYQRKEELAVKLFVGMNPRAVRAQFLFEGALLGLIGSLIAAGVTTLGQLYLLQPVQEALPIGAALTTVETTGLVGLQVLVGLLLGVAAAHLSTRKGIADG